jgi:hypothetical protein
LCWIVFTHVALEGKTGIGFFELIPGRARCSAEGALLVFFAINRVSVSASAFGWSIISGVYRNINVPERFTNHPNTSPRRITATILFCGVKGGADHLT